MSLVEIVTKDGKKLGTIDDIAGKVIVEEEWEKLTEKKRKKDKKKDLEEEEVDD